MFGIFRPKSWLAKAEAEAAAKVNCQAVHKVRALKRQATLNGLLAYVSEDQRQRFKDRMGALS